MSDDESFVILGSSPNSIQNFSSIQKNSLFSLQNVTDSGTANSHHQTNGKLSNPENPDISLNFQYSYMDNSSIPVEQALPEVNIARRLKRDSLTTSETLAKSNGYDDSIQNSPKISLNGSSLMSKSSVLGSGGMTKPTAHQGTLAANFLMGEIDLSELKEKLNSEFPSLCGSHANNEDILRLQHFMSQYVELKDTLKKNNIAMRQHFSIIQKWQEDIKIYKEEQKQQQIKFEETIAKLNNDNRELRQALENKIEHFKLNEISMREDNKELNMKISEQSAQIENMSIQIQKLENQNLVTFEYVSKKGTEDEKLTETVPEYEYVSILEHKRVTKNFERQLSVLTAKNLDLQDMEQVYLDEINCLKVNLTAAEELLQKAQTDINILKSKDIERNEFFENYQKERDEMKQNMDILTKQVEIYNNDFNIERRDRQNIAAEKEQILNELKLLQRRNQQLIEEQQSRLESASSAEAKKRTQETNIHECPLCNGRFSSLDNLQIHVQECIDQ